MCSRLGLTCNRTGCTEANNTQRSRGDDRCKYHATYSAATDRQACLPVSNLVISFS